jgi:hypothetical protein
VAAAIAEMASAQMERAAPSLAGAESLPNTAAVVVAARPAQVQAQAQAHVAAAIAEMASAQMERAAPSLAGAESLPNTAAVVVAAHPAQAQAHAAKAIVETVSAQMERAAPSMAGAESLPITAVAAQCCVGIMTIRQKRSLRWFRRRWKWLVT